MNNQYHSLTLEEVYEQLNSSNKGLTNEECNKRLEKYGENILPKKKPKNVVAIFISEIMNPIILLLVVTVIFSFAINEVMDAVAIIFIIIVDLLMGTYQEWKASKSASGLANLIHENVKVLRDGSEEIIEAKKIVIGDIVLLESGNKVSADMRLIDSLNLTVNESILTGESINVSKNIDVVTEDAILTDKLNMLYAGTSIVTGRCTAIVVATSINTEIGLISKAVNETPDEKSPLTIRMEKFSKQISLLVIFVAIIITILLVIKGVDGKEIFLSVIALSVSAMPEGLPLALTMALTIASNKMARKNVIVKKLNYVESLGSCTVIASDKTGTLTVNEQTAKKIVMPDNNIYEVTGTGYSTEGKIITHDGKIPINICKYGVINNEAHLKKVHNKFESYGDSIDIAFLALGGKALVDTSNIEILGQIPYESEKKYSAVFYKEANVIHCTVKGSLEKVMDFCSTMRIDLKDVKLDSNLINKQNEMLASTGYRVIALADGIVTNFSSKESYDETDISDLTFAGLVAFIDPIREEAKASINDCKKAGIKVVMVTGDHPLIAFAIAQELKIATDFSEVVTGLDINVYLKKGKKAFDKFIASKKVFTRVTPIDKLEIVESYKRQGEFVAVTGDGVNDAPAIKSANIGVSMGSGTDVAKETAAMIIIDDNFKSIVAGVKEGRNAYSNIRKVSYMLLSCGLAEVLFFVLSIICNLPMPLVAIQLLWLNIVTDGIQDFALSFEKGENYLMEERPRNTKDSVFDKELLFEVLISGFAIGIIVFLSWMYLINVVHMNVSLARGYIMVLMVFMQNIHVLNCRSEKNSTFKTPFRNNPLVIFGILACIILQIIVMEVPFLSTFLQTSSVPIIDMIKLFFLSTIILFIMELYKWFRYHLIR